jgi:hypothetical protein
LANQAATKAHPHSIEAMGNVDSIMVAGRNVIMGTHSAHGQQDATLVQIKFIAAPSTQVFVAPHVKKS